MNDKGVTSVFVQDCNENMEKKINEYKVQHLDDSDVPFNDWHHQNQNFTASITVISKILWLKHGDLFKCKHYKASFLAFAISVC